MHQFTTAILDHLATHRRALLAEYEGIDPVLLHARPAPERWSVAEILEHLSIVERRVSALIEMKVAKAREEGAGQLPDDAVFDPAEHIRLLRDRTRRIEATEGSRPQGRMNAQEAVHALHTAREHLIALVESLDGLDLRSVMHAHPVFGQINLHQWLAFVAGHEARHTLQIREAVEALSSAPAQIKT